MDDRSALEKIINEIPIVSKYSDTELHKYKDGTCFAQFHSTMKPETIIEKARKYLQMSYYSIHIICLEHPFPINDIKIYTYKSGERVAINFSRDILLGGTEIDNGFIYKYRSSYSNSICYIYIPNFDLIWEEDRPSRKRENLAFYCKLLSYDTANKVYKKYTGKGLSEATYLKYNLG